MQETLELEVIPAFQEAPMLITGDSQAVEALYEDLKEDTPNVATLLGKAVLNGLGRATAGIREEASLVMFDAIHNTNYRERVHLLREIEKREAFERKLGLMATK